MKKRMRDWLGKKDRGLVIVEACIVFPIMFFVIFFIIYLGNVYYQIAQVDDCVKRAAIKGAQCVVNPYQYGTVQHGEIPTEIKDVEPYRYIFGELPGASISEIERKIGDDLLTELEQKTHTFFIKMSPEIVNKGKKIAEFNNYVIYSTFQVQIDYEIRFPIRFIFLDKPVVMRMQARAEVPVNDTPEFIRNVDMVADLFAGTKADEAVKDAFTKVNNFLEAFKGSDGNSGGGPLSITANPGIIAGGGGEGGETSTPEPGKKPEETDGNEDKKPGDDSENPGGEEGGSVVPPMPTDTPKPTYTPKPADDPKPEEEDEEKAKTYKEVNIHGKINTELDEVDLEKKVIYEDKNASKLYMDNPDFPQTEQQWAEKQIFKKGKNRIEALQQNEFSLSSQNSSDVPSVEELKGIRNYVFRIDADTPALRSAVQTEIDKLSKLFPEYTFSATYGGK